MLYSAELRWFFEGDVPMAMDAWFREGASVEAEVRRDRYLVFPGCDSVGVKIRDVSERKGGRFEVKASIGTPEVVWLTPTVQGC